VTPPSTSSEPVSQNGVALLQELENLQSELDSLKTEINFLRRRDETLNFYMSRLDEELRLAARLQARFLPKKLRRIAC